MRRYLASVAVSVVFAGTGFIAAEAAESSSAYPARPVRLIVPFPPGGGTDTVARVVAHKLSESLKQQFVVDNRDGAGSIVGTQIAARAAPDGYTLLLGTSSGLVINPLLRSDLPYHPVKDFAPVSLLAINPTLLVVHASMPAATVKELIALAKAQPGKLNYATVGQGSPIHLGMELFKAMTGTDIVHVPYKGSGPAVVELVAGRVQLMFNSMPPVLPHVKAGKLKALAVGSPQRARAVPDIPTVAESGVPGFQTVTWFGLFAPARASQHAIDTLNRQVAKSLEDRDVAQNLISQGAEPAATTPQALALYMREDAERWGRVIKGLKLKVE